MKKNKKLNVLRYIIITILLIIFIFSTYKVIEYYKMLSSHNNLQQDLIEEKNNSLKENNEAEDNNILQEYISLYKKNNDLVGWIKIPNTNIDYPVMQSKTKDFYLNHDFNKNYEENGSIYVSYNSDVFKPSNNIVIYGHNAYRKFMFAQLEKYQKYDFYKENKYIYFDTLYEKNKYEIVSVFKITVKNNHDTDFRYYNYIDFENIEEFDQYVEEIKKRSLYKTDAQVNYQDQLITLSTCDQTKVDGRLVIVAKKQNKDHDKYND